MSSKWKSYYNILSESQKEKYKQLEKQLDDAKVDEDIVQRDLKKEYSILEQTEKYKLADKCFEEYKKLTGKEEKERKYDEYIELRRKAEDAMPSIENKRRLLSNLSHYRWSCNTKIEKYRSAAYLLLELPEAKGTPTDDETKQCSICTVNIKDQALPCGHIYCVECVSKIKCECPTCKKSFKKDKVIKLYL